MSCHRGAKQLGIAFLVLMTSPAWAEAGGQALYLEHCASCHGINLEGQPNWMQRKPDGRMPGPPHDATGHTWHHSDDQLFRIVKQGPGALMPGYESDMPGFGDVLADGDIRAILEYIKSTWPARERAIQASRSD